MRAAWPNTADPLGGSYFVEKLTLDMEAAANEYIRRIDDMGGMIPAIEAGFPQTEIAAASYRYQREVESGERVIVGVNRFQSDDQPIELLQIDETSGDIRRRKLAALRERRDNGRVGKTLDALKRAAEGTENTMPYLLDAVRAYATLGEICDALRGGLRTRTRRPHSTVVDHGIAPIRVLVAKPGLDGHDRGAKVIARALRDAGMEVIYTGLRQTPEMIVNAALQEDVQVIGLSILSGAHNAIVPRVMDLLREKDMMDVKVIVGGIVPDEDAAELKRLGVAAVFQPGASLDAIVNFIREAVARPALS